MTILMSFAVAPYITPPEVIASEEVRNKVICPVCDEEIDALIRVCEMVMTEAVILVDGEFEFEVTDEESSGSGLEEAEVLMGVSH